MYGHMWIWRTCLCVNMEVRRGYRAFYSIALCLYSKEMPFPRFGAVASEGPTSSREPSCLCLALSWHYRVLMGNSLQLESWVLGPELWSSKIWCKYSSVMNHLSSPLFISIAIKFCIASPFIYYSSFTVLLAHDKPHFCPQNWLL